MSEDFDRFLKSNFFTDPSHAWHDGLEVDAITRLQGEDRDKAETMLLERLPDSRAVVGLGELRSQKAVEPLRDLLRNKSVAIQAAVSLRQITGETTGLDILIEMLKSRDEYWSKRLDAARALNHFPAEKTVAALLDAAEHDEVDVVRYHACNSLLLLYGQINENDLTSTQKLSISVMHENERTAAMEELRRIAREGKLKEV